MRKIILNIFIIICGVVSAVTSSAQTVSKEMMPSIVAEMKKMCPQEVEKGMTLTDVYLDNSGNELLFEFTFKEKDLNLSSSDIINEFKVMTPSQKKEYLGAEFDQVTALFPIPIYAVLKFSDGKTFKMKLSD